MTTQAEMRLIAAQDVVGRLRHELAEALEEYKAADKAVQDEREYHRSKRFLVRDELDGVWGQADTMAEAEALRVDLNDDPESGARSFTLRVDDMQD